MRSSFVSFLISGIVITVVCGWLLGGTGIFPKRSFITVFASVILGLAGAIFFSIWWTRDRKRCGG
jgi:uncharacterized membrane protein YeaQ/YmgE (transglycosylase-associated protein family)